MPPRQPQKPIAPPVSPVDMRFPLAGVDRTMGFDRQPNRPLVNGDFARTTVMARNVRAFDPRTDRARGGSRPGIAKWATSQVNGSASIQDLNSITVTELVSGGEGPIPGAGVATPHIFLNRMGDGSRFSSVDLSYGSTQAAWSYSSGFDQSPMASIAAIGDAGGSTCFFISHSTLDLSGTTARWNIVSNGALVASGSLPGNPSPNSTSVATDGTSYYAVAQNKGAAAPGSGTFCAIKVEPDGTVTWSKANVGSLSQATPNSPSTTVVISGVLYVFFQGTGIVQVNATTGLAESPLVRVTGAAIRDIGAGGNYIMDGGPDSDITTVKTTNYLANIGNTLAIAVRSNALNNHRRGVVFYNLGTSTFDPPALLGPALTDAASVAQDNPGNRGNFLSLATDGTSFYALVANQNSNTPAVNNFVVKISGVTGGRVWGSARYGAGCMSIGYSASISKVIVSGQGVSSFLDPSTGGSVGGGLGTFIMDLFDAGTVTLDDETASEGTEVGGFNRALAVTAAAGGTLKVYFGGDWRAVSANGGTISSTARVVRSAVNRRKQYIVDDLGEHYAVYNPVTNSLDPWTVTAGLLPVDGLGKKARLIAPWRDRILLAGLPDDPNNIFAGKKGDATNFDYSPPSPSPAQAWALNAAPAGQIPDVVTALIPYSDDYCYIGCDHELWRITGDPAAGGKLDMVSRQMGVAWGGAWCTDPFGNLYVLSNHCGIYTLSPNEQPIRISQPVDSMLRDIDLRRNVIRLAWNDRMQGLRMFVTNYDQVGPATHWFWEQRSGAWWPDDFGDDDHNPHCCMTFQGNTGSNRVILIGSSDGYVRFETDQAPNDDGVDIESEVWLGPILTKDMDDILVRETQVVLGKDSGPVTYAVHTGTTAEEAFASPAAETGTLTGGRSSTLPTRWSGRAIYYRLTSTGQWSVETLKAMISGTGRVRTRQRT